MKKSITEFYNKIAYEYTKENGYDEQLSLPSLKKFITLLSGNAKVLDIGCGGGQDSKFLFNNGGNVLGIDLSKEMIKLSKNYAPGINFKVMDVMDLDSNEQFDGIWCSRVFHNISLSEQPRFLKKLNSLLKKGGVLYITSIVSTKESDYELLDANNLIIKYLTSKTFKKISIEMNFKIIKFKYWVGKKGMDIFLKKL